MSEVAVPGWASGQQQVRLTGTPLTQLPIDTEWTATATRAGIARRARKTGRGGQHCCCTTQVCQEGLIPARPQESHNPVVRRREELEAANGNRQRQHQQRRCCYCFFAVAYCFFVPRAQSGLVVRLRCRHQHHLHHIFCWTQRLVQAHWSSCAISSAATHANERDGFLYINRLDAIASGIDGGYRRLCVPADQATALCIQL